MLSLAGMVAFGVQGPAGRAGFPLSDDRAEPIPSAYACELMFESSGMSGALNFKTQQSVADLCGTRISRSETRANRGQPVVTMQKAQECENCGKLREQTKLFKCGGCKMSSYCSAACQKAHWKIHKPKCRYFQKLNKKRPRAL